MGKVFRDLHREGEHTSESPRESTSSVHPTDSVVLQTPNVKIKQKDVKKLREDTLKKQKGICPLCELPIKK